MLGGALAAAAWGEPRSTLDVDFVINLPVEQITAFSRALEERGILVPPDLMLDQLLETRGDVALVAYHRDASFKAELFLLRPGDALRASALARRVPLDLGPPLGQIYVHAPEDLILYKLAYYELGGQTKHLRDITGILLARGGQLDQAYLDAWAQRLHVDVVWQSLLAEVRRRGQ